MRVPRMTIALITLLVALSACASWANVANYLPGNVGITFKFYNYDTGVQYAIADPAVPYTGVATLDGLPQLAATGALPGEDSWGLLYLTEIDRTADDAVLWRHGDAAFGNTEITGLIYGGTDDYLMQTTTGSTVVQNLEGNGVHMALWEDTSPDFSAAAGPAGRTNPLNAMPSYATATDGTLIWTFDSVKGYESSFDTTKTNQFLDNYTVNSLNPLNPVVSGGGGFFANTGTITSGSNTFTGSLNNVFGKMIPSGVSIEINFTNTTDSTHKWLVKSNDPAYARTIPEPATSVLMLLGLLPIGIRLRRRNRA